MDKFRAQVATRPSWEALEGVSNTLPLEKGLTTTATTTLPNWLSWDGIVKASATTTYFLIFAALPTDHCMVNPTAVGHVSCTRFLILFCARIRLPEQREANSLTYGVELESADSGNF